MNSVTSSILRFSSSFCCSCDNSEVADARELFEKWGGGILPDDMMTLFNALLDTPSAANATALFERVRDFQDWGVSDLEAYTWFMTDVEWSWMSGATPIEDW